VISRVAGCWLVLKTRTCAMTTEPMAAPILTRCKDSDTLAVQAANLIVRAAQLAVRERGRFTVVLAGGSTPERTYRVLGDTSRAAAIDWSRTVVFVGDERFVPFDDARSTFGMAHRTLLARVPVPSGQVFPIPTTGKSAAEAAEAYANQLARFISREAPTAPPRFDLVLLGLGEDGHTASLFPGASALSVNDRWVTWSPPGTLPPPVDRVTMTYPVLNAARHVLFLVAGEKKAEALRDVIELDSPPPQRPAAGVRPVAGQLTWLVDEDAARLLSASRTCSSIGIAGG